MLEGAIGGVCPQLAGARIANGVVANGAEMGAVSRENGAVVRPLWGSIALNEWCDPEVVQPPATGGQTATASPAFKRALPRLPGG